MKQFKHAKVQLKAYFLQGDPKNLRIGLQH